MRIEGVAAQGNEQAVTIDGTGVGADTAHAFTTRSMKTCL
jgi:hypothetical protein